MAHSFYEVQKLIVRGADEDTIATHIHLTTPLCENRDGSLNFICFADESEGPASR